MMSGDRLVVREDLRLVPGPRLRRIRVDVVPPRPRAVRGGRPVIRDRRVLLLVRLDADDLALGLRQPAEIPRDRATRAGEGLPGFVLDLVARTEVEGRVRAELLEDLGAVARPERLLPERFELAVDPRHFPRPGRVQLVRRKVERGVAVDQSPIGRRPPGTCIRPGRSSGRACGRISVRRTSPRRTNAGRTRSRTAEVRPSRNAVRSAAFHFPWGSASGFRSGHASTSLTARSSICSMTLRTPERTATRLPCSPRRRFATWSSRYGAMAPHRVTIRRPSTAVRTAWYDSTLRSVTAGPFNGSTVHSSTSESAQSRSVRIDVTSSDRVVRSAGRSPSSGRAIARL